MRCARTSPVTRCFQLLSSSTVFQNCSLTRSTLDQKPALPAWRTPVSLHAAKEGRGLRSAELSDEPGNCKTLASNSGLQAGFFTPERGYAGCQLAGWAAAATATSPVRCTGVLFYSPSARSDEGRQVTSEHESSRPAAAHPRASRERSHSDEQISSRSRLHKQTTQ